MEITLPNQLTNYHIPYGNVALLEQTVLFIYKWMRRKNKIIKETWWKKRVSFNKSTHIPPNLMWRLKTFLSSPIPFTIIVINLLVVRYRQTFQPVQKELSQFNPFNYKSHNGPVIPFISKEKKWEPPSSSMKWTKQSILPAQPYIIIIMLIKVETQK